MSPQWSPPLVSRNTTLRRDATSTQSLRNRAAADRWEYLDRRDRAERDIGAAIEPASYRREHSGTGSTRSARWTGRNGARPPRAERRCSTLRWGTRTSCRNGARHGGGYRVDGRDHSQNVITAMEPTGGGGNTCTALGGRRGHGGHCNGAPLPKAGSTTAPPRPGTLHYWPQWSPPSKGGTHSSSLHVPLSGSGCLNGAHL